MNFLRCDPSIDQLLDNLPSFGSQHATVEGVLLRALLMQLKARQEGRLYLGEYWGESVLSYATKLVQQERVGV